MVSFLLKYETSATRCAKSSCAAISSTRLANAARASRDSRNRRAPSADEETPFPWRVSTNGCTKALSLPRSAILKATIGPNGAPMPSRITFLATAKAPSGCVLCTTSIAASTSYGSSSSPASSASAAAVPALRLISSATISSCSSGSRSVLSLPTSRAPETSRRLPQRRRSANTILPITRTMTRRRTMRTANPSPPAGVTSTSAQPNA